MMTSKSESPVSAQVPIMNPLPDNWQRRFKVVKIVSSEPFRRGRWLCMDFKDPPSVPSEKTENKVRLNPPTIEITNCDSEIALSDPAMAQVYEIPINQTHYGNFVMGNQQQMYGIILPPNDYVQPVTLVQDLSILTTSMDRNSNPVVDGQNGQLSNPRMQFFTEGQQTFSNFSYSPNTTMTQPLVVKDDVRSTPSSQSANVCDSNRRVSAIEQNNINNNNKETVIQRPPRNKTAPNVAEINARNIQELEDSESFSSLANELSRASGFSRFRNAPQPSVGANGHCSPAPVMLAKVAPTSVIPQPTHDANFSASHVSVDSNSAASTGTNTVAIDNKIEQAMDLVKSHLMFAVREEVEVLKEKITELLERISQLEHENDILRANASAETLKQLNSHSQQKILGGQMKPQPSSS